MSYLSIETSRHSGAPLELYRFIVGGQQVTPVAGTIGGTVEFLENFESYADTAAMVAAGWTYVPGGHVDSVGSLDLTGGVGGSKCAKIVSPIGDPNYAGGVWTHLLTGLVVGDTYTVVVAITGDFFLGAVFIPGTGSYSDGPIGLFIGGIAAVMASAAAEGSFETLTLTFVARSASHLLQIGWYIGLGSMDATRTVKIDNVEMTHVTVTGGDDGETPDPEIEGYTSADVPVVFDGLTYQKAQIVRTEFRTGTTETRSSEVEISLPRDHPLVTTLAGPPRQPVEVEIFRVHRSDLTVGSSIKPWVGQAVGLRFEGPDAIVTFANERALLDRKVPRYLTQRACGHMLYDVLCQVGRLLHTRGPFTVSAVDGRTVTVDGAGVAAADRVTGFSGGILVAADDTLLSIEHANGDALTLKQGLPSLTVGDEVSLVFGCDKRAETCHTDYHNMRHYGGEFVMPIRNPGTGAGLVTGDGGSG